MASPMQIPISLFLLLLLLTFQSLSTSAATVATSTVKTSSKDQAACQMCTSCDNPCPVYPPPPPTMVLCPPPPPPPSPPPAPKQIPQYPPPTCPNCQPCIQCTPGVIGGAVYGPPNGGSVPYFPNYNMNPPAAYTSPASSPRKVRTGCAAFSLLLAALWF